MSQGGGLHEFMDEADDCHDGNTAISALCAWVAGVLPFEQTDYMSWDDLLFHREDSGFVEEMMPYWAIPHFFSLPQEDYENLSEPEVADWPLEAYLAMMVADDTDNEDIIIKFFKLLLDIGNELYFDTKVDAPSSMSTEVQAHSLPESESEPEPEPEPEPESESESEEESESEAEYNNKKRHRVRA